MKNILLNAKNLSFELPTKSILRNINLSVAKEQRIGLIGKNGSGKTTLLRILSGEIDPEDGTVIGSENCAYVPQIDMDLYQLETTLRDFLEQKSIDVSYFEEIMREDLGWQEIPFSASLKSFSGGELMKIQLTVALTKKPKVLLLDEPTNHLDLPTLEMLRYFLINFEGAFIIVSHDSFFLNQVVDEIIELKDGKVDFFGGNYNFYLEQKKMKQEGQRRHYELREKKLGKLKYSLEKEKKRSAKSERVGKKMAHDRSMSNIEKGFFKNKASKSKGRLGKKIEEKIDQAESELKELKIKSTKPVNINLYGTEEKSKRTLFRIEDGQLIVGMPEKKLINEINFYLSFGERVQIAGANGTGKSCLVKAIIQEVLFCRLTGKIYLSGKMNATYVSQKYENVNPQLTIIENIQNANKTLDLDSARQQLGRFLFRDSDLYLKAGDLSGGEIARLSLAIATARPIDLLILDEPTNNLDIETTNILVEALKQFPGAILVISHNIDFLDKIEVEKTYVIQNNRLILMHANPHNQESFYEELINRLRPI